MRQPALLRWLFQPFLLAALLAASGCAPQEVDVVERLNCAFDTSGCGGSSFAGSAGVSGSGGSPGGAGSAGQGGAFAFAAALVHRYSFRGTDDVVVDSVNGANGRVVGTQLNAVVDPAGAVELAGERSGQHIELPTGIVSRLESATFEAWVTWYGQDIWERIFDFGDVATNDLGTRSYLFFTPLAPGANRMRVAQQRPNQSEFVMDGLRPFPTGVRTHVAVVVDSARKTLLLFVNGRYEVSQALVDAGNVPFQALSTLRDATNYLGRSHFAPDAYFGGIFHEFRIYGAPLSPAEVEASALAGPDPDLP